MLKELSKYENLGTPSFFLELFRQLADSAQRWNEDNIREHFYNRIVDGRAIFDGCVPLAAAVGAISIDPSGGVTLNPVLSSSLLISETYLCGRMLNMIITEANKDDTFHNIFCSENISYDVVYRMIQIDKSAFHFRNANFRELLASFGFLYSHPDRNIRKLIINSKYRRLFDKKIMPEVKRRKMGIDELKRSLEQKLIYGEEGEDFALAFEKNRLVGHPHFESIEIISEYDVYAGYDIVSYNEIFSAEHDRFIEVKSYSGKIGFHWSRNEIDIARIKRDNYFLYLVDRSQMSLEGYRPLIIQNPYYKILEDSGDWKKIPDGYFITAES